VLCRSSSTSPSCTRSLRRSLRRSSLPSWHSVKWGLGFNTSRVLGFVSPQIAASHRIHTDERDEMGCLRSSIHVGGREWAATVWAHPAILWAFFIWADWLAGSPKLVTQISRLHRCLWAVAPQPGQISFYFSLIFFVIY
jgi:hypothetical protein